MIDLPKSSITIIKFRQVFAMIAALGVEILHPSLASKSHGQHGNLMVAYKNLMSILMKICCAEIQDNALKPKIKLQIKGFSNEYTTFNTS